MNSYCERVLHQLKQKDASQPEFLQAVEEVLTSVSLILIIIRNMRKWRFWNA